MKVYLLYSYNGEEMYPIVESVCATLDAAEKEKQKIVNRVEEIKTAYHSEYENLYDFDCEWIMEDTSIYDERYDNIVHRVYDWQAKYSELDITGMRIEEKYLIPDYLTQLKSKIPHERYNNNKLLLAFRNLDWGRVQPLQIRVPKDLYNDLKGIEKEYLKRVMAQYPNVDYKWE